jgi:hypothetical protein
MIIFRVTTGRSFTELVTVKDGDRSKTLQFARQTAESFFLHSKLSDPEAEGGLNASAGRPTTTQTESTAQSAHQKLDKSGDSEKV